MSGLGSLEALGLPNPLVWPEPAGTSVKWRRGVPCAGHWSSLAGGGLQPFMFLPGFRMAFVAVALIQHSAVKHLFTGKLQIDSSTSVSKGLVSNSLGHFEHRALFFCFPSPSL